MAKNISYYKIINFKQNGALGISTDVIETITKQAILDTEGVSLCIPHSIFVKGPINIKINNRGGLFIKISIKIEYGHDIKKTCEKIKSKIEHDLMYMTEINPRKISIKVDEQ